MWQIFYWILLLSVLNGYAEKQSKAKFLKILSLKRYLKKWQNLTHCGMLLNPDPGSI